MACAMTFSRLLHFFVLAKAGAYTFPNVKHLCAHRLSIENRSVPLCAMFHSSVRVCPQECLAVFPCSPSACLSLARLESVDGLCGNFCDKTCSDWRWRAECALVFEPTDPTLAKPFSLWCNRKLLSLYPHNKKTCFICSSRHSVCRPPFFWAGVNLVFSVMHELQWACVEFSLLMPQQPSYWYLPTV